MFAIAGNTKYQGLLACLGISSFLVAECFVVRRIPAQRRLVLLGIIILADLAAGAWAMSNLVRYHNPFYPIKIQIDGATVFDGPVSANRGAENPAYLLRGSREVSLPEPINFLLSASEFDWTMRGVAPWYNVDSVTGRVPRRGPPSRTGGWGGLFVLVNGWLLGLQIVRLRRQSDSRQRLLVINTLLVTIMTACMPRSHELRYWLYLPLIFIPVNLRYLREQDGAAKFAPHMLVAMMLYCISLVLLSPKSDMLAAQRATEENMKADMPPEIGKMLASTGKYCDPSDHLLFRYSTAATGVKGLLSRNVEDCH